jgi:hypothetical protein
MTSDFARWLAENPPPSLQDLVDRAGRRHAAEIGEAYEEDPFARPAHQGGFQWITEQEWQAYDAATEEWEARRRAHLENQIANNLNQLRRDVAMRTVGARPRQNKKD